MYMFLGSSSVKSSRIEMTLIPDDRELNSASNDVYYVAVGNFVP